MFITFCITALAWSVEGSGLADECGHHVIGLSVSGLVG